MPTKIQYDGINAIIIDVVGYHVFLIGGERYRVNWENIQQIWVCGNTVQK